MKITKHGWRTPLRRIVKENMNDPDSFDHAETLYKLFNDDHNPKKILQSCTTRWLSIESAVTRIHHQYLELKTYFALEAGKANCFKVSSLAKLLDNELHFAYICFLKPILQEVQRVNKIFESERADFVKVLGDLEFLIMTFIKKIIKVNCNIESESENMIIICRC